MNNPLRQLGNIPVTASVLESLFPHIKGGSQKLRLLERDKQIIRLKRDFMYAVRKYLAKLFRPN